jgi:hypothetical protein
MSDERLQCLPARPGPGHGKATTHWTPTLVICASGFGTANYIVIVCAQLFLHLPERERGSGDHHFTQAMGVALCPAGKPALVQVLSRPDSRVMALLDHKNAGWQLLSNLGLFIIVIIRVYVNRFLDGRECVPWRPIPHFLSLDKTNTLVF